MISETYKMYVKQASVLGDYQKMSKTELADGYYDAREAKQKHLQDEYFAALMLRYWYKIYEWKNTCTSLNLELDDFVSWLEDSILVAFQYSRWKDPTNKLYRDKNAADKVINRAIFSTRGYFYQTANYANKAANYNLASVGKDTELNIEGLWDLEAGTDSYNNDPAKKDSASEIILKLLKNKDWGQAIVADCIAYEKSFTQDVDKKYNFNIKTLITTLKSLDDSYLKSIVVRYGQEYADDLAVHINQIKKLSRKELQKYITEILTSLQGDKDLKSLRTI